MESARIHRQARSVPFSFQYSGNDVIAFSVCLWLAARLSRSSAISEGIVPASDIAVGALGCGLLCGSLIKYFTDGAVYAASNALGGTLLLFIGCFPPDAISGMRGHNSITNDSVQMRDLRITIISIEGDCDLHSIAYVVDLLDMELMKFIRGRYRSANIIGIHFKDCIRSHLYSIR
jgi:hypothetical protein